MADMARPRVWPGMRRFQSGPPERWRCAPVRYIRDVFDNETIDDLLARLETLASAADYPADPIPLHLDRRANLVRWRRSKFDDLRSRTVDRDLDEPPLKYRDFPKRIALAVNYADPPPRGRAGPRR